MFRQTRSVGRGYRAIAWVLVMALALPVSVVAADPAAERLGDTGVLLLRHALAPGFGDHAGFRVDDCSTQRNLSDEGRQQARATGDWFRARGIGEARVYSSQWCRCLETARLLDLGPVSPLPALNSFFETREDREPNLAALREFLADQAAVSGPKSGPLILVTHQVTVTAVTGLPTPSGGGVVATLVTGGELADFARIDFDD